jgi:hypothetical protein
MAEEKRDEGQAGSGGQASGAAHGSSRSSKEQQTGDPGRTPGAAEGDRQTVEEDLASKEGGGK